MPAAADTQVVLKFLETHQVRLRGSEWTGTDRTELIRIQEGLSRMPGVSPARLFAASSEEDLDLERYNAETSSGSRLADLNQYFVLTVNAQRAGSLQEVLAFLRRSPLVEFAYPAAIPRLPHADIAPTTPNWVSLQGYRAAAPAGIDADYAASVPGGMGAGVRFIDAEQAWTLPHEDLPNATTLTCTPPPSPYGPPCFSLTPSNGLGDANHGNASLGVVVAESNGFGITGIAPSAMFNVVSWSQYGGLVAPTINAAVKYLGQGDVLLIEAEIPGPTPVEPCPTQPCYSQFGLIPVEWEQATFDAIRYATAKGVVVIEAAGNGSVSLDSPAYVTSWIDPATNTWRSGGAFDRNLRDSGATIVGASALSVRAPIWYTNYGTRLDLHAWGDGVASLGYGTLFDPGDPLQRYVSAFSGTSSASAIVAGAAVSTEGVMRVRWGIPLLPNELRRLLANHGTPQDAPIGHRIGPMPDLRSALNTTCSRPWIYYPVPGYGPLTCQ